MTTSTTSRTPRSPDHLGLPPPLTLDLTDMGRTVGWVRGDVIGFRGFGNAVEAAHAAWVAHRAIARRLARRDGRRPIPVDSEPLSLDLRGDVVLVLASGTPIATLRRPDDAVDGAGGDATFGFELRVPAPADELAMRSLAYMAYRTLRKSGTRWTMWRPDERRAPPERVTSGGATVSDPDPARATPGFALGAALLALVAVLVLALVEPATVAIPFALAAIGALALSGIVDRPARWWARRSTRTHPTVTGPAVGRRTRAPLPMSTAVTTASVVALLLAFTVPERLALILAAAGLAGLVAVRSFAMPDAEREGSPSSRGQPSAAASR